MRGGSPTNSLLAWSCHACPAKRQPLFSSRVEEQGLDSFDGEGIPTGERSHEP
jgi:hypothetical protein